MIEHDENITYHTVTLGALTREGDATAKISVLNNEEGTQQTQTVRVPAGLTGERVTIAVEAAAKRRPGKQSRVTIHGTIATTCASR